MYQTLIRPLRDTRTLCESSAESTGPRRGGKKNGRVSKAGEERNRLTVGSCGRRESRRVDTDLGG